MMASKVEGHGTEKRNVDQVAEGRTMYAKIQKAERHGWVKVELGCNGCYMSRVGRDGRVYVAYLSK